MIDAVDLLEKSLGFRHFGIVLEGNDDSVGKGVLVDALIGFSAALLINEAPSGDSAGFKIGFFDVVQLPDRSLHRFRGLLVITVDHICCDLILTLQRVHHIGKVV